MKATTTTTATKTVTVYVQSTMSYRAPVLHISNGRYGEYVRDEYGLNNSLKKLEAEGYTRVRITTAEIAELEAAHRQFKAAKEKQMREEWVKSLGAPIEFTFVDGTPIATMGNFKNGAENIGQATQGSDRHEAAVKINGEIFYANKHWSNDNIGITLTPSLREYVGTIEFFEGKIYLRK